MPTVKPGTGSSYSNSGYSVGEAINGFINTVDNYPDDDTVVVVLGNTETSTALMLATTLARNVLGLMKDEPIAEAKGRLFVGRYPGPDALSSFQLSWEKGQLFYVRLENSKPIGPKMRLLAQGNDTFVINENSAIIRLDRENGKITGGAWELMNGVTKVKKEH